MLTTKERVLFAQMSDRLIELYVRRDEALRDHNWEEARHLGREIDAVAVVRNNLLAGRRGN